MSGNGQKNEDTPAVRVSIPVPEAPMVGRQRELVELETAAGRAFNSREPQAISLIGGAGMGKRRIVSEFLQRVSERHQSVRVYRGIARRAAGPTHRIVQQILRARFEITENMSSEEVTERLRTSVSELLDDRRVTEFLHFLGAFLELSFPESPFTKAISGDEQQLSRISRAVLRRFLELDAQKAPMVLTFEQLHWASDETLDIVEYIAETAAEAGLLVVVTARPELLTRRPTWGASERHRRLDLAPLTDDEAKGLMEQFLSPVEGDVPRILVEKAVEMASGSPYLLQQMVRTYLDSGILTVGEEGVWSVDLDNLDDVQLPLSVDDAIAARVGALTPPERELLEMASTMGSVFWLGALVSIGRADRAPPELWGGAEDLAGHYRDLLNGLVERDYLMRTEHYSMYGEEEFAFKHNLERDAVHRLMSSSDARRYHHRVAEWLEMRLTDRSEQACSILARHYDEGGAPLQAAYYYLGAADRARARYANRRAADLYRQGLSLLKDKDIVRQLDAQHNYGDVLQLLGENTDALGAFRRMLEIAYQLDVKSKGGAAHNRIGRVYRAVGQLEQAMRHLGTGHALFDGAGDRRGVASSLDDVGKVHWMRGAYDPAEQFMRRSLEMRRELGDQRSIALSLNNLGLVYQDSGRFDAALEAFQEALAIRRAIDDQPGIAQTLNNLGTILQDSGEHSRATATWREALACAERVGDRMRQAVILTNLGESCYRQDKPEEAIGVLKQAERISTSLGDRILEAEILRDLAKAHLLVQDLESARGYVQRSVALFEAARSQPFLGVALRTQAEIEAGAGDLRAAEESFRRSLDIFEELGNEVELAQSCESYAEFLGGPGNDAERAAALRQKAQEIQGRQLASESYFIPSDSRETDPN